MKDRDPGNLSVAMSADNVSTPAVNTAAVITYPAVANQATIIGKIIYSYSGNPAGGNLTITEDGATVFSLDIFGPGEKPLDLGPLRAATGAAVVITLAAGGTNITGKLNVPYVWGEAR